MRSVVAAIPALLLCGIGVAGAQEAPARLLPVAWKAPVYTEAGYRARIQGSVELELVIEPSGRVAQSVVTKALPMGLDQAAMWPALRWTFEPSDAIERRTHVVVQFQIDPLDAWEDGSAWAADGTLLVWRLQPGQALRRGLDEGRRLDLSSTEALDAIAAVVRDRATGPGLRLMRVTIGSAPPDRAFIDRFSDLGHRVWRSRFADALGAQILSVAQVSVSPRGPVIVAVDVPSGTTTFRNLYAVERNGAALRVVDSYEERSPVICRLPGLSPLPRDLSAEFRWQLLSAATGSISVASAPTDRRAEAW